MTSCFQCFLFSITLLNAGHLPKLWIFSLLSSAKPTCNHLFLPSHRVVGEVWMLQVKATEIWNLTGFWTCLFLHSKDEFKTPHKPLLTQEHYSAEKHLYKKDFFKLWTTSTQTQKLIMSLKWVCRGPCTLLINGKLEWLPNSSEHRQPVNIWLWGHFVPRISVLLREFRKLKTWNWNTKPALCYSWRTQMAHHRCHRLLTCTVHISGWLYC